ncbi:hypothetical protein O4328_28575 [Rhodococcus opacus]|uniref:Extradiol ring-cleavage dioxygenase LigAB LigA subunit domain-containing protein n=1 Tax=Rhodococcus opacus TaxID=37919 RepID=A0ABT4NJQ0_RHOOP|nr:hypothetical protein [Rhodococcus opacus]MCZ4587596.1 hypothetical protein [Rhodococcus opacus]
MTAYALQRAVFDFLRARENGQSTEGFSERPDLDDPEKDALKSCDIGALASLGVHRVLLSGFARENGIMRETLRDHLRAGATTTRKVDVPWRK